ncbi:MAG: hypothetical protein KKF44_00935 [Nanoarchaeota archaeon]|nr:hypothetical protein [Nanoarchaeota archaeon]
MHQINTLPSESVILYDLSLVTVDFSSWYRDSVFYANTYPQLDSQLLAKIDSSLDDVLEFLGDYEGKENLYVHKSQISSLEYFISIIQEKQSFLQAKTNELVQESDHYTLEDLPFYSEALLEGIRKKYKKLVKVCKSEFEFEPKYDKLYEHIEDSVRDIAETGDFVFVERDDKVQYVREASDSEIGLAVTAIYVSIYENKIPFIQTASKAVTDIVKLYKKLNPNKLINPIHIQRFFYNDVQKETWSFNDTFF